MNHKLARRAGRLTLFAALTAVVLAFSAACGSSDKDAPLSGTDHNGADVSFAQDMIQHHAQALAMVNLTVARPLDPDFKAFATRVRDAQGPEIETMVDWLGDWGEDVPATSNDHAHGDMGTMPDGMDDMPGIMSTEEMDGLKAAPDADFEKMWLEMMIRHHRGAIEMAEDEQKNGQFKAALDLADSIIGAQTAEIDEMNRMLSAP